MVGWLILKLAYKGTSKESGFWQDLKFCLVYLHKSGRFHKIWGVLIKHLAQAILASFKSGLWVGVAIYALFSE